MSLLCNECDAALVGPYQILCLLGHTKTGWVTPEESLVRGIVCSRHTVLVSDTVELSRLQERDADALIFALVQSISSEGDNFNGNYSIDQGWMLKKSGDFKGALYISGANVRTRFPTAFASAISEISKQRGGDSAFYRVAIERYLAKVSA